MLEKKCSSQTKQNYQQLFQLLRKYVNHFDTKLADYLLERTPSDSILYILLKERLDPQTKLLTLCSSVIVEKDILASKIHTIFWKQLFNNSRNFPKSVYLEALAVPIISGHKKTLQYLLSLPGINNGSDLLYAIDLAIRHGQLIILKQLVENLTILWKPQKMFVLATKHGHLHIIEWFLQKYSIEIPSLNKALITACEHGYLAIVKKLLVIPHIDPATEENYPLMLAAKNGHTDILQELLCKPKVNPAVLNNYPIRIACTRGHTNIVLNLLDTGKVDPTIYNDEALVNAAGNGNDESVYHLLDHKNSTIKSIRPKVLEEAVKNNNANILFFILNSKKIQAIKTKPSLLESAAKRGFLEIVNLFFSHRNWIFEEDIFSAFLSSARNNHPAILKKFLEIGEIQEQSKLQEAMALAACRGHYQIVKILLLYKTNPCFSENFPLYVASRNNHPEVVKLLLDSQKVDPEAYENKALSTASEYGHAEVVAILLQASKKHYSHLEQHLFEQAFYKGNFAVVKVFLMHRKVDLSLIINPLRYTAEFGNVQIMQLFMTKPFNWNHSLALQDAALQGHKKVVSYLLNEGVKPEKVDLFVSVLEKGHLNVAKILLESGTILPSYQNNYALRWSIRKNYHAMIEPLLKYPVLTKKAPAEIHNALLNAAENGFFRVITPFLFCPYISLEIKQRCLCLLIQSGHNHLKKDMVFLGSKVLFFQALAPLPREVQAIIANNALTSTLKEQELAIHRSNLPS